MIFWEDMAISPLQEIGRRQVSKADIIGYAKNYDPQPFHLDEEAGKASILGGLCASGWHVATMAAAMAEAADGGKSQRIRADAIAEWRWIKPVFVDEWLILHEACEEKVAGEQAGEGRVRLLWEMVNEKGEVKGRAVVWRTLARRGQG